MKKKTNNKKRKNKIFIVLFIILVIILAYLSYYMYNDKIEKETLKQEQNLIKEITSHYNNFVKTNKDANIYNDKEEVIGKIAINVELSLEETKIDKNTKYFKLVDFDNSYIKYEDLEQIDNLSTFDNRYKNYIVFNQNIVTNDITSFYDENNNLVYELNKSFDLPIIIKDNEKYGIEFNNRLLYVNKDDVKEIKDNHNTDLNNASGVAVLNYHAFYDETNKEESRECSSIICHSKKQFKEHLDYFKENNILTLKMNEIEMYLDKKIQLPKSVLITIDDGGRTTHAINMLTEYKMYATIFLVTSWYNPKDYPVTEYIELHSHTHNLHNTGDCPTGQGGGIQCLAKDTILSDLKTSRELLNNSTAFCFPFYEFNNYAINLLKEAGFTMAFIGERGDMLVKPSADKFKLTRFVITKQTTMTDINNYFNQIKN